MICLYIQGLNGGVVGKPLGRKWSGVVCITFEPSTGYKADTNFA